MWCFISFFKMSSIISTLNMEGITNPLTLGNVYHLWNQCIESFPLYHYRNQCTLLVFVILFLKPMWLLGIPWAYFTYRIYCVDVKINGLYCLWNQWTRTISSLFIKNQFLKLSFYLVIYNFLQIEVSLQKMFFSFLVQVI